MGTVRLVVDPKTKRYWRVCTIHKFYEGVPEPVVKDVKFWDIRDPILDAFEREPDLVRIECWRFVVRKEPTQKYAIFSREGEGVRWTGISNKKRIDGGLVERPKVVATPIYDRPQRPTWSVPLPRITS